MRANDIRPGMALKINNELWVIRSTEHVKPGKGPAYVQVKIKSIITGSVNEKRFRTAEDVEQAILDRRDMEYLYTDSSGHVFMDQETFDQVTLDDGLVGESMVYVKPNTVIEVLVFENNPIAITIPLSVELEVTDTTPQVKGATATNQLKEATMETGLKTRVPPFIQIGEVLKINTEDGSYVSRV